MMHHHPNHGKNIPMTSRRIMSFLLLVSLYLAATAPSMGATLLPNGKQTFLDASGNPLASGTVTFYVPGTTTPKTTWADEDRTVANANPLTLDSAGRALIYGSGCYRQIVKTSANVTQWDAVTCDTSSTEASWGGTATGTPNAIVVTAENFTGEDGQVIRFIAAFNNTGATTVNPSSFGNVSIVVDGGSGPVACSGGEIIVGNVVTLVYDANAGVFHLSTLTTITAGAGLSTSGVGSSGGTLAVSGTLTSVQPVNAQTGTTYTVLNTDNAKLITFSNASAVTVTVPTATGNFAAGFWFNVLNLSTGTVTLVPATGTINGAASATLPIGAGSKLVSDGANWQMVGSANLTTAAPGSAYGNLTAVNTTGSENSGVTVTADYAVLRSTSGFTYTVSPVSVSCNFTITGAGGLDTGALSTSKWYFVYIISNTSTTSCLGSLSSTAPTMPSGYSFKLLVAAFQTDGSSNFYRIRYDNDRGRYTITTGTNTTLPFAVFNGVAGSGSLASPTLAASTVRGDGFCVPPIAISAVLVAYNKWKDGAISDLAVAPTTAWGGTNNGPKGSAGNVYPYAVEGTAPAMGGSFEIVLEANTIAAYAGAAGGAVRCLGWRMKF